MQEKKICHWMINYVKKKSRGCLYSKTFLEMKTILGNPFNVEYGTGGY